MEDYTTIIQEIVQRYKIPAREASKFCNLLYKTLTEDAFIFETNTTEELKIHTLEISSNKKETADKIHSENFHKGSERFYQAKNAKLP